MNAPSSIGDDNEELCCYRSRLAFPSSKVMQSLCGIRNDHRRSFLISHSLMHYQMNTWRALS
jgi:hypothetical protein